MVTAVKYPPMNRCRAEVFSSGVASGPEAPLCLEHLASAGQLAFEHLVELTVGAAQIVARPVVGFELDG